MGNVLQKDLAKLEARTKLNRGSGGLRPRHASRHLTKEEEIREVYAMEARLFYGVLEAAELGWYDFEIGGVAGCKGVG